MLRFERIIYAGIFLSSMKLRLPNIYVYFELNNKLSFKIGVRPYLEISPYILHVSFHLRDKEVIDFDH